MRKALVFALAVAFVVSVVPVAAAQSQSSPSSQQVGKVKGVAGKPEAGRAARSHGHSSRMLKALLAVISPAASNESHSASTPWRALGPL